MLVNFELKGEMPLLMHADDVMQADVLDAWRKNPANRALSKPGDDRSPAWTWQTYLYSDGVHVAIPSANLMVALRQAGAKLILKGSKTLKEVSQSGLLITSEFVRLYVRSKSAESQLRWADVSALRELPFNEQFEAVQKYGFCLYVKRARVGQSKHVRVRARFDSWVVRGSIAVLNTDVFTDERLEEIFREAGKVGLCDWRPGCRTPGPWGQFTAELQRE